MSVDDALASVLERLSDAQLEALAAAVEEAAAPTPALAHVIAGASPSAVDAASALRTAWEATPSLTGAGIALGLRVGLAARRDADGRRARPVWTGPGATGEQRLTSAVLHELLAGAVEGILLVSFAAYTLTEVAADLEAAVARGCQVDVVFETTADSAGGYAGPDRPFEQVKGITRWRWPAKQREAGAVLHAKLLVVDGRQALVGSANLTHRALTANMEAGVLIRDDALACQLDRHVRALMASGVLARSAVDD